CAFAQVAGVVDAAVTSRVDLDDVEAARAAAGQVEARGADAAGDRGRALLAVQAARQDARARRLAAAAWAGEEVGVVDPVLGQGPRRRAGDVLLADHLGEGLGTVAAVQRGHIRTLALPGDASARAVHVRWSGLAQTRGPPAHPPGPTYPCCLPAL